MVGRVKKIKMYRWLLVLLMVPILLVGSVCYVKYRAPQHPAPTAIPDAQSQLAAMPVYGTIKQQDPQLYQRLNEALLAQVAAGVPLPQAIGQLRGMLVKLLNQRIGRASDDAINHYMMLSVKEMQSLRAIDPLLCFKFLFPQVDGGVNIAAVLPAELQQDDLVQTDALLKASTGPEHAVDLAGARTSLQGIVLRLYHQWGRDLQWLNVPADANIDRGKVCDMTIDLYREVLMLPPAQAANVLRMMLSANAG